MYATVNDTDTYWSTRMNGELWANQSTDAKTRALQTATDRINALSLSGDAATTNTDNNHYPLDGETTVPDLIVRATKELALCLILNPDLPGLSTNNVKRSKQGQTETEFIGDIPPWEAAGIPCHNVWLLLSPFMSDPMELTLERVN